MLAGRARTGGRLCRRLATLTFGWRSGGDRRYEQVRGQFQRVFIVAAALEESKSLACGVGTAIKRVPNRSCIKENRE